MNLKSYALCPVSDKKVNERIARINGVFTIILLIISVVSQSIIPMALLTIDFLLRASDYSRYSVIGIFSKGIVSYFGWKENIINAGPKIFAARLGFIMSSLILILLASHFYLPAFAFAAVLGVFSILESTFGFCVACEIYPFLYRFLYKVKFQ